jgi:LL-diaminopimelate aminotransferase
MNNKINFSERVKRLPPYIFSELEKIISEKKKQGKNIISLSIGDPDLPPPQIVLEALKEEVTKTENHNYSFSQGEPKFREAVATWYKRRFNVNLNSQNEVIGLIGSKEGLANITRAFTNPGDKILVPDPSYPVYANGSSILCDCIPLYMPLKEDNFKPDLLNLKSSNAKIMFLNYPNNPTGATVDLKFLKEVVKYAKENKLIICYDNAYSEITFNEYEAPSILQIEDAIDVAIEFHSCSKTFNMTGDRIGFAVGNEKLIEGLRKVKTQIDSGPPIYIQNVAIRALETYRKEKKPKFLRKNLEIYKKRQNALIKGLKTIGLKCEKNKATFYLWVKCPEDSFNFVKKLLDIGVLVTPGIAFGKIGTKYIRFALTKSKDQINEACKRLAKLNLNN